MKIPRQIKFFPVHCGILIISGSKIMPRKTVFDVLSSPDYGAPGQVGWILGAHFYPQNIFFLTRPIQFSKNKLLFM